MNSPLPPPENTVQQIAPPSPDQSTLSEALHYLEQAKEQGEASPTVADYAAKLQRDQQNFLQRMREMDHAHHERMIRTAGEMQIQTRMADAHLQVYLRESHETAMAALRSATGKGDLGTQLTGKAIDFTFDWLRSKF